MLTKIPATRKIIKQIYMALPLKRELFNLIKTFYTPPYHITKYLRFNGFIDVKVSQEKTFKIYNFGWTVENSIFWYGLYKGWEPKSICIWIELCKRSKVIVDIGANTGVFALIAKCIRPEARVFAVEPLKIAFEKLLVNVKKNSYDIECIPNAISNTDSVVNLYDDSGDAEFTYQASLSLNGAYVNKDNSVAKKIEAIKMDTFIEKYALNHLDLIKIDAEFHEAEVFEGFQKYIKKFQPNLIVELTDPKLTSKIEYLIQDIDYTFFDVDEQQGLKKINNLRISSSTNVLICKTELIEEIDMLHAACK